MWTYLAVGAGGALGAMARYAVSAQALHMMGPNFPWGTLFVNVLGSFLIGVLVEALALKINITPELRLLLVTGFLGGFTTFSAFSLDAVNMAQRGDLSNAAVYVVASVTLSIGALIVGLVLTRWVLA